MLPTRTVLVPIFKRFLEMKLNRIDELAIRALDHHLIAAKVGSCQKVKTVRYTVELQAVVLPNTQNAGRLRRFPSVLALNGMHSGKDRIRRINYANESILVLGWSVCSLFVLFKLIKSNDARSKAETDELMSTADSQDGYVYLADEFTKSVNDGLLVKIE